MALLKRGLLLLLLCATMVSADNTGNFDVSTGVSGTAPIIIEVVPIAAANPTQFSTTQIIANFTAESAAGNAWLNDTTAECHVALNTTNRFSVSCSATVAGLLSKTYSCPIVMHYYDIPGVYKETCYITDMDGNQAYNDSYTFTYNSLAAISINPASLSFGTLAIGTTSGSISDPLIITNEGNSYLGNITVKAYDLHAGANTLGCANYNASAVDAPGGVVMANDTYHQVPTAFAPVSGAENIYFWVRIPEGTTPANYATTNSWVLAAFTE